MRLKQLLLTATAAVCLTQTAVAVPAYPHPRTVTQADGTPLTIVVRGDEWGHLVYTADGYPLLRNAATGNYEYASVQQSKMVCSGIVAANADRRTAAAQAFLQGVDVEAVRTAALAERRIPAAHPSAARKAPQRILTNNFPHTGSQHSLVILVQFSDKKFSVIDNPKEFYTNCLNQEGFTSEWGATGSARDYFIDSSNGNFSPTFDVIGPVTVAGTVDKYGQNQGMSTVGDNAGTLLLDAIALLDDEVDFSQYDHDGDGYVDNIYLFYAGYGAADSHYSTVIWPHSFSIPEWGLSYTTNDGIQIGSYTCSNEIDGGRPGMPDGIGTFVHEFGHCLGLADHYDTGYGYAFSPSDWDVMASGSYNNDSNTPPAYSAFERMELGWMEVTELSTKTDTVSVLPELGASKKAYKVTMPDDDNEYFLLENRQQTGWDTYLPGHGMLVWHVDMDEKKWQDNTVNNNYAHQNLDIVEADGIESKATFTGDPFPGSGNVTQRTFKGWSGAELFAFDNVTETNDTIRFLLANVGVDLVSPDPIVFTDVADSTVTATWTPADNADYYEVSVTTDGKTVADYNKKHVSTNTLTLTGLTPETTYDLTVKAALSSYRSDAAMASVTTTEIPFAKLYADTLSLVGYTNGGFIASWTAVRDAQAYELTLNERICSDTTSRQGTGFDGKLIPASWQAQGYSFTSASSFKGEATPSMRLNTAASQLTIAYPDTRIAGLSFFTRAYVGTGGKGSTLVIERYADGQWTEVMADSCTTDAHTISCTFEMSDSVRIRFNRVGSNCYAAIDDVYADCYTISRTPVPGYAPKTVEAVTRHTFSGLKPGAEYGLSVLATNNGERGVSSPELVVVLPTADAILPLHSDDAQAVVYDLQGRRMTGQLPQGIYLVRKNGQTVKTVVR